MTTRDRRDICIVIMSIACVVGGAGLTWGAGPALIAFGGIFLVYLMQAQS